MHLKMLSTKCKLHVFHSGLCVRQFYVNSRTEAVSASASTISGLHSLEIISIYHAHLHAVLTQAPGKHVFERWVFMKDLWRYSLSSLTLLLAHQAWKLFTTHLHVAFRSVTDHTCILPENICRLQYIHIIFIFQIFYVRADWEHVTWIFPPAMIM